MSHLYHERAAECMKLSMIGCDTAIREGYRKLAEAYLKLANTAEAKQEPPNLSIKAHFNSSAITFGAEHGRSAKRSHVAAICTNTDLSWGVLTD